MAALIKGWEERNQDDLRKLTVLITKTLNVVKGCGGNAVVKHDVKTNKLIVFEG